MKQKKYFKHSPNQTKNRTSSTTSCHAHFAHIALPKNSQQVKEKAALGITPSPCKRRDTSSHTTKKTLQIILLAKSETGHRSEKRRKKQF